MIEIYCQRSGSKLEPVSQMDEEKLLEIPEHREVTVRIVRKRSLPQHRLYWALLNMVMENLPEPEPGKQWPFMSTDQLHEAIKIELGFMRPIKTIKGDTIYVPDSIAFDRCDQECFQKFFERALDLISTTFLHGGDPYDMLLEAARYAGLGRPRLEVQVSTDNAAVVFDTIILRDGYRPVKVLRTAKKDRGGPRLDFRGIVGEVFPTLDALMLTVKRRIWAIYGQAKENRQG